MADVHLRPLTSSPRTKPAPKLPGTKFFYASSDDGTDENLLILLHGLGDSHRPFAQLARSLKLPQTAVLALRAPTRVPLLDEEDDAWEWYPAFTLLGEPIENPNPTSALDALRPVLVHLTKECGWVLSKIHLIGFAQGGTVALELALEVWKDPKELAPTSSNEFAPESRQNTPRAALGSVVSISGPLLSFPTSSAPAAQCPTAVLFTYRTSSTSPLSSSTTAQTNALARAFSSATLIRMGTEREGMPVGRAEWEPIMRFWSQRLSRRQFGSEEGLYEVMSGMAPPGGV